MDLQRLAPRGDDFVGDVGRGLHQVDVRLLLQTLLHNFHVQQAQKAAAKAEAEASLDSGSNSKLGSLIDSLVSASRSSAKS